MTWVVSSHVPLGYGIVISDTCVTFENGATRDLVQKSYPVAANVLAGFAGGVKNGFILIDDLRQFLYQPDPNRGWDPEWVAEKWSGNAMRIYENDPNFDKGMETHIIITAAHPNEDIGIPGCAKIIGAILKSPDFHPEFHFANIDFYSIGSGNHEESCQRLIAELRQEWPQLMQAEVGNLGGLGMTLESIINNALFREPVDGISSYLHHFMVGRRYLRGGTRTRTDFLPDGSEFIHPRHAVATSWAEFERMVSDIPGARANSAVG